jgi:hypothetical protein
MNEFDLGLADGRSIANVELPKWAKSPMEYVYLNRKALESSFVSGTLHCWIDLIFGVGQRGKTTEQQVNLYKPEMYDDIWENEPNMDASRRAEIEATIDEVGQVPPQLFSTSHPRRRLQAPTPLLADAAALPIPANKCVFGVFCDERDELLILCESTQFLTLHFNVAGTDRNQNLDVTCESHRPASPFPSDLKQFVKVTDKTFAALCNNDLECLLIDTDNCRKVPISRQRITAISATDSMLAISSADARTHVFALGSGKLSEAFSIPTYRNSITCSFLSKQFGIIVSGTDDKALVVALLADGSTVRVIHVDFVPQKVLVTPHWGFILVHGCEHVQGKTHYSLAVFNVNGIAINSVPFRAPVDEWIAVTSPRGFDFVIMTSQKGKLFAFEVFFLDIGSPIYRCWGDIVCLGFSKKTNVILAASADGKAHVVPFLLESVEKYHA